MTSQVPLCDQYHPVSEICEKQATSDIDPDHSVAVTNTIQETKLNYTKNSKIRTGWLRHEVTKSFLCMLTKKNRSTLYCSSTEPLVVEEGKSFWKLWKNEDLRSMSFTFLPSNPKKYHWILVAVNLSDRATGVLIHLQPIHTGLTHQYKEVTESV